jgi:hypothetical protein
MDGGPMNHIPGGGCDAPHGVDGDHKHPDEGEAPKTPEEGDAQKSLDEKMSEKMSKRMSEKMSKTTTNTFQTGIPAGKTINQLTAGKEPETTVDSPPTAKTKVTGVEISKSTTQTRLVKLVTESSTALTPTAAEENPAEDKSEEVEEEATDEPMETFTKPVMEDIPATDTPTPPAATEASQTLEDIVTTFVVIPEQNRKATKKAPLRVQNNQAAQFQVTFSKMATLLGADDDAFTGRAFPINPDPEMSGGTKVPNMPGTTAGTDNKPKVIEPDANAAQANMTSYEAEKMARPRADPPEVAREGTKGEYNPESDNHCSSSRRRFAEPTDKLPMTTMACHKIHIFAEDEVTF